MCKLDSDCELKKTVDNMAKDVTDLRKDLEGLSKLVYNHNDTLIKIDTRIEDGVSKGVEKALKGLDKRVSQTVDQTLKDNRLKELEEQVARRKGFMDHGIKSLIGWAVIGVAGVILIIVLGYTANNNTNLTNELAKIQTQLDEQSNTITGQKDLIKEYESIILDLKEKVDK